LFGRNDSGQIGNGKFETLSCKEPYLLNCPEKNKYWKKVVLGVMHSLGLTNKNDFYVWGFNNHDQLGLGHKIMFLFQN